MRNSNKIDRDAGVDIGVIRKNADALFKIVSSNISAKAERHGKKVGEAQISNEFIQSFISDVKNGFDDMIRFSTADIRETMYLPKNQGKSYEIGSALAEDALKILSSTKEELKKNDIVTKFEPVVRKTLDEFIQVFKESEKQKSQPQEVAQNKKPEAKVIESNKSPRNIALDSSGKEVDTKQIDISKPYIWKPQENIVESKKDVLQNIQSKKSEENLADKSSQKKVQFGNDTNFVKKEVTRNPNVSKNRAEHRNWDDNQWEKAAAERKQVGQESLKDEERRADKFDVKKDINKSSYFTDLQKNSAANAKTTKKAVEQYDVFQQILTRGSDAGKLANRGNAALSEEDLKWIASLKDGQNTFESKEKTGVLRDKDGQSGKAKASWVEKLKDEVQKVRTDEKSR